MPSCRTSAAEKRCSTSSKSPPRSRLTLRTWRAWRRARKTKPASSQRSREPTPRLAHDRDRACGLDDDAPGDGADQGCRQARAAGRPHDDVIASPAPRERYSPIRDFPAFRLVHAEVGSFLLRNLAGVVELAPDLGPGGAELLGVPARRGPELLLGDGVDHQEVDVGVALAREPGGEVHRLPRAVRPVRRAEYLLCHRRAPGAVPLGPGRGAR